MSAEQHDLPRHVLNPLTKRLIKTLSKMHRQLIVRGVMPLPDGYKLIGESVHKVSKRPRARAHPVERYGQDDDDDDTTSWADVDPVAAHRERQKRQQVTAAAAAAAAAGSPVPAAVDGLPRQAPSVEPAPLRAPLRLPRPLPALPTASASASAAAADAAAPAPLSALRGRPMEPMKWVDYPKVDPCERRRPHELPKDHPLYLPYRNRWGEVVELPPATQDGFWDVGLGTASQ